MKRLVLVMQIALAGLLMAACASVPSGTSQSIMVASAPVQTSLQSDPPPGSALVVLRYPATVETEAEDAFHLAYRKWTIGGTPRPSRTADPEIDLIADAAIVKSSFFALTIFKEFAQRLPDHTVMLSPHAVTLDEAGALTSTPLTEVEKIPSVLTVDFATYSFPDPELMMGSAPLTFGELITPLVVVRTDHRAAAPTNGILLASSPLIRHAGGNAQRDAETSLQSMLNGNLTNDPTEHALISYIAAKPPKTLAVKTLAQSGAASSVQVYPLEKISLDRDAIMGLGSDTQPTATNTDPFEAAFASGFADRVVQILNRLDARKAVMVDRAAAMAEYDDALGALSLVGLPDEDFQTRIRYAERLMEAERKYLSVQSLRLFDGVYNGETGAQIRDMLKAEVEVMDERRKMARQQNMAVAAAVLGAVATGVAMSETGSNPDFGQIVLNDALLYGTIFAGMKAYQMSQQTKAVGANFLTSIAPALDQQTEVQVDLIESSETITAIRFEDLKDKLKTMYAEKQRALQTVATECSYSHDGPRTVGKWQGECDSGSANGVGVGVMPLENGSWVEYYGHAINGQPHGVGYMIIQQPEGTYALEGEFANGKPNGLMRVVRAGSADQIRQYQSGEDVGPAPRGSSFQKLFPQLN